MSRQKMINCINCLHFKAKKGWLYAYCSQGGILNCVGKNRLFKIYPKNSISLLRRAKNLQILNRECILFENMDDECSVKTVEEKSA